MTKLPISVCIVAGNEAHRIRPALDSVKDWTREIIVAIDDKVTDGTDKVAAACGAKVISQPWTNCAAHRNFASAHASQPWLLAIDADEVVSEKLRDEIVATFQRHGNPPLPAAYSFPRLSFFGGRWIRHGDWYPDRKVRLWRKDAGQWEGDPHEKLVLRGEVVPLRSDLLHYSNESIDHTLKKIAHFSSMFVRRCQTEQRRVGWTDLAIRPFWKFFRAYILRRGFLDGWPGYFIAWMDAFSTVTRYAKVIEAETAKKKYAIRSLKISLVISAYNQPAVLAKVLQGLQRQTRWPEEVLFSDDGSGEPTKNLIAQFAAAAPVPVRHIWHPDDGFRKTVILNKTLAAATGDYLIFTDADCVPHPKFVADHAALAENGFWVQGRRCFVREEFVPDFSADKIPAFGWMLAGKITGAAKGIRWPVPIIRRDTRQRGIIGCNMAFWREDLVAVNGFDEDYTGWGTGEDSDVATRVYHLGRRRKFVYGRAITFHLNHPQTSRDHHTASLARLAETIASGKIRCEHGLNLHL